MPWKRRLWPCLLVGLALSGVHPALGNPTLRSTPAAAGSRGQHLGNTPFAPPWQRARVELDPDLQAASQRLLAEARPVQGGIVAVHVPSGRVLVLQEFRRAGQRGHPLTQALVPAASLFKLVTTVALFERGGVSPSDSICISGGERGIERSHLTPPPPGSAGVSCHPFEEALGHSRNAVFAQLAIEHLLRRDLLEVAEHLGFNRPLPFDVPAEMGVLEVPYNDLDFARTATGFRGTRLSVLGAARLGLLVATGGKDRPMIFQSSTPAGEATDAEQLLDPQTARRLRRMMEVTVHSGTSLEAFTDARGQSYLGSIRVAGKTGTLRPTAGGPTASWFVGFAPSRAPEVVVSVLLDNSPVWRRKANHVARDVLRAYFRTSPGVTHPFDDG
jgi:cell division protein FtsI/penicillin-binding protein 2